MARARLQDATALHRAGRYDGAAYLCGYAIEVSLKARICQTLRWMGFPETNAEFRDLNTFKTHNLDLLLRLSGIENRIRSTYLRHWSTIARWDPEIRYNRIGTATAAGTQAMIDAARELLKRI